MKCDTILQHMESNFEKYKAVFVNHEPYNKNLFNCIHECHELEYLTRSLQPIFTDLNI